MTAYQGFWLVFSLTLALLATDLLTGLTGRRGAHLTSVALTVVGLAGSVFLAIRSGHELRFEPRIHAIHRTLATGVVVLLIPMLATGIAILRGRVRARPVHRRFAYLLLTVAVAATVTGILMVRTGVPREAPPASTAPPSRLPPVTP